MSSTAADSGKAPITRLPDFFPTFPPLCKAVAEKFFACFEEHAVMKNETDAETPKQAIPMCQESLRGYIACVQGSEEKPKKGGWW